MADEREQEQNGLQKSANTAMRGQNAYQGAKRAKGAYDKYKKAKNTKDAANNVKTAAKAGAEFASGNVVGGATELAKNKTVQKIVIGIIAVFMAFSIAFTSAVPSALYIPVEDARGDKGITWVVKHPFAALKKWIGGDNVGETLVNDDTKLAVSDEEERDILYTDDNNPTNHTSNSIQQMIDKTTELYQARIKETEEYINTDAEAKRQTESNSTTRVEYIVNTPTAISLNAEAVRLLSLYSAQTDSEIIESDFEAYLAWLGDKPKEHSFFTWKNIRRGDKEEDKQWQGYEDLEVKWDIRPLAWSGTMLSQPDMDTLRKWEEVNPDDEYDIEANPKKLFFTSALEQAYAINPVITRSTRTVTETDDAGNDITITVITYSYSIDAGTESGSNIINFIDFNNAEYADNAAHPAHYRLSDYQSNETHYKGMAENTFTFFKIDKGSAFLPNGIYGGGGFGNGNEIVSIALGEVGYVEGYGNHTKYGQEFGMDGVAWCNIFVSWCASKAGISSDIIPQTASCIETYNFYNSRGLTHSIYSGYVPKSGDLVLRGPRRHIGIVEKLEGGTLYTVEGNTSGGIDNNDGEGVHYKAYPNPSASWTCYCEVPYPVEIIGSGVAGMGEYVDVPEGYGTCETYEKEIINPNSSTHGWGNWGAGSQGGFRRDAIANNRMQKGNIFGLQNCAIVDNRLMIATKPNIGGQLSVKIGDYVDVTFADGTVWNCIIGDEKGRDAPNKWGHDNGKSVVEIIYWDYSSNSGNQYKKVSRITKVGSYY